MKKAISLFALVLCNTCLFAQENEPVYRNEVNNSEVFRTVATIATVVIFMLFIITLLRMYYENRLKNKIVDKGIQENVAASILQSTPVNNMNSIIKWACLLAGMGTGLFFADYTKPLGIHSLAIMAFSLSASFIVYYFFIKYNSKKE